MNSGNDTLTQLRELLKKSQATLKQCESSYTGFLAFEGNNGGMVFCTVQLQQAASALRDCADGLVALARKIDTTHRESAEQLELLAAGMTGRP
jgi:hypothetical protein